MKVFSFPIKLSATTAVQPWTQRKHMHQGVLILPREVEAKRGILIVQTLEVILINHPPMAIKLEIGFWIMLQNLWKLKLYCDSKDRKNLLTMWGQDWMTFKVLLALNIFGFSNFITVKQPWQLSFYVPLYLPSTILSALHITPSTHNNAMKQVLLGSHL